MLKKRIDRLEARLEDATARWIRNLSTAELETLAGPISPEEEKFLASLTNAQLADCAAGRVSLGEYEEWRESWALKNALNA